jgi:hypothetical protein
MKPWLVAAWIAFCTIFVLWLFWAPLVWLALAIDGTGREDYTVGIWINVITSWIVMPCILAVSFVALVRLTLADDPAAA